MIDKVHLLLPELALFAATCIVMVVGLSPSLAIRRLCAPIAGLGLIAAGILGAVTTPPTDTSVLPGLVPFAKVLVAVVGLLLLLLAAGTVDRTEERLIALGRQKFNPLRTNRAEFYAFFLFSLTGVMLCASADDLIWLFLALELTSLPTYIMVTISSGSSVTGRGARSHEAGVKYFFLGALGAATFLYGFALLYGGTGTTDLAEIRAALAGGEINGIAMTGLLIALAGVAFKIAAVPMHFYTPDVYEGASSSVAAFLAFVPKTAGFIAIILLVSLVGAPGDGPWLPEPVRLALWVMAALTMTVGNVLAILQTSVKRMLAYSSIAHSGYMLVGVVAGPGDGITENGLAAVLFYLLCYGVMNMGAFAVLACLERPRGQGEPAEIESVADLRGLCRTHPALGWTMVLCALSLLGFPPLLGFLGKFVLFSAAITRGEIVLVVVLGLNSAIAAFYYLRLVAAPLLESPDAARSTPVPTPFFSRPLAAMVSAGGVVILAIFADGLMDASGNAGRVNTGAEAPREGQVVPGRPNASRAD
ncbi:MAG: NADH-quinone oxidoreductase subunit N [Phycisphaerales bacterium]